MKNKFKIKKKYNAAFLVRKKKYLIKQVQSPKLDEFTIVVKIKICSICGSDLKIFENGTDRFKLPQITGHEISGIVVFVGDRINEFAVGDKVSIGADLDNKINCAIGHEIPGGFSEYMFFDKKVLKKIPIQKFKNIGFKEASLAEPLACCLNGFEQAKVKKNSNILIIGGGPIGLILTKLSKFYNAKNVILIEKSKTKIKLIKKLTSHIDLILDDNVYKNKMEIEKITGKKGINFIFTANSNQKTQQQAFQYISYNGTVNLFGGLPTTNYNILPVNDIHYKQLKVVGSHGSTKVQHRKALELLDLKKINLNFLFTHHFQLKNIEKALDYSKKNTSLKITTG